VFDNGHPIWGAKGNNIEAVSVTGSVAMRGAGGCDRSFNYAVSTRPLLCQVPIGLQRVFTVRVCLILSGRPSPLHCTTPGKPPARVLAPSVLWPVWSDACGTIGLRSAAVPSQANTTNVSPPFGVKDGIQYDGFSYLEIVS